MYKSAVYKKSPVWAQETLIHLRSRLRGGLREGRGFPLKLAELLENERLSFEELKVVTWKHLRGILTLASTKVPYYQEQFSRLGLEPEELRNFRDLERLPVLSKKTVQAQTSAFLVSNFKGRSWGVKTSGTSGAPLAIRNSTRDLLTEHAFKERQLIWAGVRGTERNAWIRGEPIVPVEVDRPPFWRYNKADNTLMMSSYHLAFKHARAYIEAIERFDPVFIKAYPSSVGFLARCLAGELRMYKGRSLKAIMTSSETLDETTRMLVQERWGCPIYDWYGSAEKVAAIGTCEEGNYHLLSDYGFVEFKEAGKPMSEIIGTSLFGECMPFIRYEMSDTIEMDSRERGCGCGRCFPLVKSIVGRTDDYIRTPNGRWVGRLGHIAKGLVSVAEAQIVQWELEHIEIRVVAFEDLLPSDERMLVQNARTLLGGDIRIEVLRVDSIPRTKSGKFRYVVNHLESP